MNFKQSFQKYIHKITQLWETVKTHRYVEKATSIWRTGKVQKSSRITYDVFWNIVLFFIIIGVIGFFFVSGVGAGYFASLVKDEPVRDYESMEKDIYNYEETSSLYFADSNYIGDIRSDIYREEVTLDNVSDILKQAVISTEDEYFSEHEGIVPKAIVRALVQQVTNSPTQSGGSTLTQQLIKNQILTNEVSFERKAKEILLALRLERFFEKDDILEAYLNIVPYGRDAAGGNIAGIQTAAQGIFGIDASDVNLPQAAYLAGLPQSPSYYTPFKGSGGLKEEEGIQPGINRMKSVLERMYNSDSISEEEYNNALNYDITADFTEESPSPIDTYPYLTFAAQDRAQDKIIEHLAEEDGYSMEDLNNDEDLMGEYEILAERSLRQDGYEIYTTIDKETQTAFKEIAQNYNNYGSEAMQASGIMINNSNGRIIGFLGGRNFNQDSQFNYATQAERSNGSTMKPILTYAPAFEKGIVQPGTPVADVERTYSTADGPYSPGNYGGGYHGLVSAREALTNSYNIPTVEIYSRINDQDPVSEFLEPMGITSIGENEYANLSLGIGGTTNGITVEENVNAFATFANQGEFADAHMIEKITDQEGNVIYEHETERVEVFSPQTAYLTLDVMRDVIDQGTGTYVQSQIERNYVDWAGKTGTSQDYEDAWFVGVNPNVSMGVWMGYDEPSSIQCPSCSLSYSQRNQKLWAEMINAASDINPELVAPETNFERPGGIVSRSYCAISGMLPSDLCERAGLVETDIFNAAHVPTEEDDSLMEGSYVMVDGEAVLAGDNTPTEFTEGDGLTFSPAFLERKGYDDLSNISSLFPRTNREAWENISLPESEVGSNTLENDGEKPAAPGSVSASGDELTWNASASNDVVGYRIYGANDPDSSYNLIGSTTETNFTLPNDNGVYRVMAVDYFGLESSGSAETVIGDFSEPDEPEEPEEPEEESNEDSNNNSDDNNNDSSDNDNSSNNDDTNDTNDDNSNNDNSNNDDDTNDTDNGE